MPDSANGRPSPRSGRDGLGDWLRGTVAPDTPAGLLGRIRWLLLAYGLAWVAVSAVQVAMVGSDPTGRLRLDWVLRGAAIAGLAWLAWHWWRGHRKGGFSLVGDLGAVLALFLTATALGNPARVLTLVYAGVFLRALYGSQRRAFVWTALAFGALVGAVAWHPTDPGTVALAAVQLPTLALVTWLVTVICRVVTQSERGVNREQILSRASATLVRAPGREALHNTALEAVMRLLDSVPRTQAAIWEGTHEDMQAVAAKGHRADEVLHRTIRVRAMPEPLRGALRDGRPTQATGGDAGRWARALGSTRPAGAVIVQPLVTRNDLRSVLILVGQAPLPVDLTDALGSLSNQISLVGELRQSERRFRSLVHNSSDVVTVVGPDATIRYVSPSVERVFGYKPAELRGVWLDDLAHPDDRANLLGYLYTASRQPQADDAVQWRWRDREGIWRDVETVGTNLVHMPDVAGVVLNTRDVSERKALERERGQLLDKTVQAAEEERTRLAAELHDGPIQRLTTTGFDLTRAHRWIEKRDLGKAIAILESSSQQLSAEINNLRKLMASLRPPVLDEVGLEAALIEHMKLWSSRSGVKTKLNAALERRLDPELETVLYRVTQEALNNVAKHARAQNLWVALRSDEHGGAELEIRDDGVGFSTTDLPGLAREGHFGLVSMRQRVEMAGGRWAVASAVGEGVTILARFGEGAPAAVVAGADGQP